jgi:predicted small secreted protein
MRALVLCLFVVLAGLALGGCPVFTRGAGEGRPIADGQQP